MKDVYVLGDIHCNFAVIANWIIQNQITNTILIQVGDFGIGFSNLQADVMKKLDDLLASTNNILYVIRGNHDNPSCFVYSTNVVISLYDRNGEVDCSDLEQVIRNLKQIHLLPDYTVLDINDEKWLFIGGAISIDRKVRVLGTSYWIDEKFIYDEEKVSTFENIDRVITHSSPDFCPPVKLTPIVYSFAKHDGSLISELLYERKQFTAMFSKLQEKNKIKSWYFGHFHQHSHIYHGVTEFIGLDIDEFKQVLSKDDYVH
jgi:DNA repair exonuclease SbcCD nuclease subunit